MTIEDPVKRDFVATLLPLEADTRNDHAAQDDNSIKSSS